MFDYTYHVTLRILDTLILGVKMSRFCHLLRNVIVDGIALRVNL